MRVTAKIWPVPEDEATACLARPETVDTLFHRVSDGGHALIHGARSLGAYLDRLAGMRRADLRAIGGTSDPTYVMSAAGVIAMFDPTTPLHRLVIAFRTEAANRIEIAAIAKLAARAGNQLMFCVFEDW